MEITMSSNKSRTAAIVLFAAAASIALGVLTKSWFSARGADGGVGLLGIESCRGGACVARSWGEIDAPGSIATFGYLGFVAGLAAAAGLVAAGVMLLTGRAAKIPVKPLGAALTVGALGMLAFSNAVMEGRLSPGWSLAPAFGGLLVAAIALKVMVMPLVKAATAEPPPVRIPPQPQTMVG
jgi:hypothetical protein